MLNFVKQLIILFKKNKYIGSIIVLTTLVFFSYFLAFFNYFQADEWYFFSKYLIHLAEPFGFIKLIFAPFFDPTSFAGHFAPVLAPIKTFNFLLFRLNFILYQLQSIILHIFITLSIFYFAYLFSKNILFSFITGLFFAISVTHFQAVSWVGAVEVQFATLFSIISLIYLEKSFQSKVKEKKYRLLSKLFFVLAIFTKESSLFLFFTFPFIIYLHFFSKINLKKNIFEKLKYFLNLTKFVWIFCIIYTIIIFSYQNYVQTISSLIGEKTAYSIFVGKSDIWVIIYKFITWTLKSFVETFIPANVLYSMGELVTIWGFPQYAVEASVRGINFLTFAQSAGIELFIYPVGILIIFILGNLFNYFKNHDKNIFFALMIGISIILSTTIPFIFVANSLIALFGSVTILDSRHLYTDSLGGALIFAAFFVYLIKITENLRNKIKKSKQIYLRLLSFIPISLLVFWVILNFIQLQVILIDGVKTGDQRKKILNEIKKTVPFDKDKVVIFVNSNSAYYGFGLMPPFQTNLGQIFSIILNERHQFPYYFLNNDFLTKQGIAGQGYLQIGKNSLGYYIEEKSLLWDLGMKEFQPNDIFAFSWDGQKNIVTNITNEIRKKANERLSYLTNFEGWNEYSDKNNGFTFKYPKEMFIEQLPIDNTNNKYEVLKDVTIFTNGLQQCIKTYQYDCDGLYVRIKLIEKPELMGTDNFAALLNTSDGVIMEHDYTFRVIKMLTGDDITTVYATKGVYTTYFIPFKTGNKIFQVTAFGSMGQRIIDPVTSAEKWNVEIERIISTIQYDK